MMAACIIIGVGIFLLLLVVALLCIALCDQYLKDRNVFRDNWLQAYEERIWDLKRTVDDLLDRLSEYEKKEKENENQE